MITLCLFFDLSEDFLVCATIAILLYEVLCFIFRQRLKKTHDNQQEVVNVERIKSYRVGEELSIMLLIEEDGFMIAPFIYF